MAYKMVNEALRIATCGIEDLTMQQVESFLSQWEEGARIGTLTLFYDNTDDLVVINREHERNEVYLALAERYLGDDDNERTEIKQKAPECMKTEFLVLDNALKMRNCRRDLSILVKQRISVRECENGILPMLRAIMNKYGTRDLLWLMLMSFNYGVICGKRMERSRKRVK